MQHHSENTHVRVRFDWAHQRNGSKNLGFPDFPGFRKMSILGIFPWDLGSGKVCNRLEMAVGFKWMDSQPISSPLGPFSKILQDFNDFAIVSNRLTLFPEGPRTLVLG